MWRRKKQSMERADLEELCQRRRVQMLRLMEVADLTAQLAQALDRRDQVSVTLLLSMREEPLHLLEEMERDLRAHLLDLPQQDAIRANELLRGAQAETEEEAALCEQTARYRRLLESVSAQDRQLSLRIGGARSFYRTFRPPTGG